MGGTVAGHINLGAGHRPGDRLARPDRAAERARRHRRALLRSVDRHGRIGERITGDGINRAIRRLAAAAQVPGTETYTTHSLRAASATVAYAAGVPVSVIARHGRWAPPPRYCWVASAPSWTLPGNAPEVHRVVPSGPAITCTFIPCTRCLRE